MCWRAHSIPGSDSTHPLNPATPIHFIKALQELLQHHATIFSTPAGLPPSRLVDHQILLVPYAPPINVRPYWYPYFHKTEIQKLISGMLAEGII